MITIRLCFFQNWGEFVVRKNSNNMNDNLSLKFFHKVGKTYSNFFSEILKTDSSFQRGLLIDKEIVEFVDRDELWIIGCSFNSPFDRIRVLDIDFQYFAWERIK